MYSILFGKRLVALYLFVPVMLLLAKMLLPLFIIPLCVLIASLFPGGWVLSAQNLMPKLERLNPLGYFQRITKPKHLADFATTAAPVVLGAALVGRGLHRQSDGGRGVGGGR